MRNYTAYCEKFDGCQMFSTAPAPNGAPLIDSLITPLITLLITPLITTPEKPSICKGFRI